MAAAALLLITLLAVSFIPGLRRALCRQASIAIDLSDALLDPRVAR